jgi:hypothetical protein
MLQHARASVDTQEAKRQSGPAPNRARGSERMQTHREHAAWSGNQSRLRLLPLQRKLAIGSVNDPLETEADRFAEHVTRTATPSPLAPYPSTPHLSRKCTNCKCAHCKEEEQKLQTKSVNPAAPATGEAPDIVHDVLRSSGQSLDPATRSFFEPRFDRDFSDVRIHTGIHAAESARQVNALAYTVGPHIAFGANRFAPGTFEGRRLIAHELTHVVQQSNAPGPSQVIRRKALRDRCSGFAVADPCGSVSKPDEIALLAPYRAQASQIEGTLGTLGAVLRSTVPPVERAHLLRIACCQLEPEDAAVAHESFANRTGTGGRVFHGLASFTQCALLAILEDRASRVGRAAATEQRREAEDAREKQIRLDKQRRTAEQAQWDRDVELHAKAGRTTWFDVLLPSMARQYRIPYADRIHDPVLKWSAQPAERAATVSIAGAILDPLTRPIEAIIRFVECLVGSLRREDFRALGNRFGLKLQVWMQIAFGPGAVFGAVEEAGRLVKQVVKIIIHPIEFAKEVLNMVKLLWAPNASELACAMGEDLGAETSKDIGKLATLDDHELAWELGKLAGPLLLNTMIALVAPEAVAFLKGTRIGKRLLILLKGMKSELKFLEKWRRAGKGEATALKEEARFAEATEIAAGDAARFLEEHPPVKIEKGASGERHASLDQGHKVVEVPDASVPGGIACEFHSPGPYPKVPCPKGMGGKRETVAEFEPGGGKIEKQAAADLEAAAVVESHPPPKPAATAPPSEPHPLDPPKKPKAKPQKAGPVEVGGKRLSRDQITRLKDLRDELSKFNLHWEDIGLGNEADVNLLFSKEADVDKTIRLLERRARAKIGVRAVHSKAQRPEEHFSRQGGEPLRSEQRPKLPDRSRLPVGTEVPGPAAYGGFWGGERGNSEWFSDVGEFNQVTHGQPIQFKDGFPDFEPWTKEHVRMTITGDDSTDFALADDILAKRRGFPNKTAYKNYRSREKLTWHHKEGANEMILVPTPLHENVPHIGGASEAKAAATSAATVLE